MEKGSEPKWKTNSREVLRKHLPEAALEPVLDLQERFGYQLTITNPRNSKLGDYRAPLRGETHRITINGNLNPYQFLVTLLHEIAHLTTWEKHKNRVLPHGLEWKREFRDISLPFLQHEIFPKEIIAELSRYLLNPAASSCADDGLLKIMRRFDPHPIKTIADFSQGELFGIPPRIFRKGELVRKRYKCLDVVNNKVYLVHPQAEVHHLPQDVLDKLRERGIA